MPREAITLPIDAPTPITMADSTDNKPQVIFLDAVGTLFGVRDGVGQIYGSVASHFGVQSDPHQLNQAFLESWKAAPPMAFPGVSPDDLHRREFQWWGNIVLQTFSKAGAIKQFKDFPAFFSYLYDYFATADPWVIYDDTFAALQYWKSEGIELGIISNFDSRIHAVLENLGLTNYFQSITISTEVGAAKPNPTPFLQALEKHDCSPRDAWHIGDSLKEDYEGARAAGIHGILIQRS